MFPVNLIQFPARERNTKIAQNTVCPISPKTPLMTDKYDVGLHFSLVFVTALGLADAVLSLPVQDLLELLLLPADAVTHMNINTAA